MSKMTMRNMALTMAAALLGAAGCGEGLEGLDDGTGAPGSDGVSTKESDIIGGSAVSVATRRSLGLIDVGNGCSGGLVNPDWVLTAAHCADFANPTGMVFRAPRTDAGSDQRLGSYIVQLGSADMVMIRLQAAAAGNMWPNVTHPITTATESSFVGQNLTCYGRGNTAYQADGVGVTGFGAWRTLTKTVQSLVSAPLDGDAYRVVAVGTPGTQVYSFGDSGSNCYDGNNRLVAVETAGNCGSWQGQGTPTDPGCNNATVISHLDSLLRALPDFRTYMVEAPVRAATTFRPITTFLNGWSPAPFGANRPSVTKTSGMISLRGAMASGTASAAFNLPAGFRPSARVYVPVVTANATIGRVVIQTNGDLTVEGEGGSLTADARIFTSLDGVSFAENASGTTALTLTNGWVNANFSNRAAAVRVVDGFVRFQGAIAVGTTANAFVLPAAFRPTVPVWAPVGLCNAAKGRLNIATNGQVSIQAENNNFAAAQCFTSLEGASFPLPPFTGSRGAVLQNGWTHGAFGAGSVRYRNDGGIVRLQGGTSGGTNAFIMTLDAAFRPATNVWIYADAFNAKRARLKIQPDGGVLVDPASQLTDAAGFLSFDGAAFGL